MVGGFLKEKAMRKRRHTKLIHEGDYVAKVNVELMDADEGWSPYLSLDDAKKLDDVREALRKGDLKRAARLAHIYTLKPVASSTRAR
jgi:hypothetical protein